MVATDNDITFYSIDLKTGLLKEVGKMTTDETIQTCGSFTYANSHIVLGFKSGAVKAFKLERDADEETIKSFKFTTEFIGLTSEIRTVSTSFDKELIAIVGEEDKCCKLFDFKTGAFVRNLTFSEEVGAENIDFTGAMFSLNRKYLYCLMTAPNGKNSYATKWEALDGEFNNSKTLTIAGSKVDKMCLSPEGFYIGVTATDGSLKAINTRFFEVDRDEMHHEDKITDMIFSDDSRFIITLCEDDTYKFVSNQRAPGIMRTIIQLLMLSFLLGYVYCKISETFF